MFLITQRRVTQYILLLLAFCERIYNNNIFTVRSARGVHHSTCTQSPRTRQQTPTYIYPAMR